MPTSGVPQSHDYSDRRQAPVQPANMNKTNLFEVRTHGRAEDTDRRLLLALPKFIIFGPPLNLIEDRRLLCYKQTRINLSLLGTTQRQFLRQSHGPTASVVERQVQPNTKY